MPKGFKVDGGYATVDKLGGLDYRSISRIMTDDGHPMNHATARNKFLQVMCKIVEGLAKRYDVDVGADAVYQIAKSPYFQTNICDLVQSFEECDDIQS